MTKPTLNLSQAFSRAISAYNAGKLAEAEQLCQQIINTKRGLFDALHLLAVVQSRLGKKDTALASYDRALKARPDSAEALFNRGWTLHELKRFEEALASYDRALKVRPDLAEALCNRGLTLHELKRLEEALASYDRALTVRPGYAEALCNRGLTLHELKRLEEALASYDRALMLWPDSAEVLCNRGLTLHELKRFAEALASYDRALTVRPDYAEALSNRGNTLKELRRFAEALASYDHALKVRPDYAEALFNRGNNLKELKQFEEALASYDCALKVRPDLAEAHSNRGLTLHELKRLEEALASYDHALVLRPDIAEVLSNRGNTLKELKRFEEAYAAYDKAFRIKPELKQLAGNRLHAKQNLCDWANLEDNISYLLAAIRSGQPASSPFMLLAIPSSAADQLQCAKSYIADLPSFPPLWSGKIYAHDRIRVAYLSSDFREHPVAYLTAGLFEEHDKSRFEVTAISYGPQSESDMRRRLKGAFERFIDVRLQTDEQVAKMIHELEIDIAVDLNGITQDARPNVLARRPVPIQVNYLGYASTMGADYIDYVIADSTVIPRDQFEFFSEKVVWLPDSFMANDARRPIAERTPTRGECALPEDAIVFCCFNNSFKIAPDIFKVWMRLLKATDNSVLWLRGHAPAIVANLRREAETNGVPSDRIIFAPRVSSVADHLARQRQSDLFLDTLPYNAHATASDALWAGVPVLTCLGATFAGRVAASLNYAIGLPELVTNSLEEYEALALKLAHDPALLAALKAKLASHHETYPLFDTKRFTRHLEAAYTTMWQLYQRGKPPFTGS